MPKILIIETCLVNLGNEQGTEPVAAGALVTVGAAQAAMLTTHGRALYTKKGDDHAKGNLTAPADIVAQAESIAAGGESKDSKQTDKVAQ
jgi:hypothetical protein